MEVVDLKITTLPKLWNEAINTISSSNDPLRDNYLHINFDEFLSFTCVVHSDRIIAFSGLQYDSDKWGPHIARCSSRMWIHPDFRFNGLTRFVGGPKFLNSYYCIPKQLEVALSNGISTVFVSREHNPVAFDEYLSLLNINAGRKFNLSPDRYWVCGGVRENGCLQYVGIHHLKEDGNEVWQKYMADNRYIIQGEN